MIMPLILSGSSTVEQSTDNRPTKVRFFPRQPNNDLLVLMAARQSPKLLVLVRVQGASPVKNLWKCGRARFMALVLKTSGLEIVP